MIKGLYIISVVLCHTVTATERSVQCDDGENVIQLQPGERIRFTSALYPNALRYEEYIIRPCQKTFLANGRMKFSFINLYTYDNGGSNSLPITLYGVDKGEKKFSHNFMNLVLCIGYSMADVEFEDMTFFASKNLTFHINEEIGPAWNGFEATVEIIQESDEWECPEVTAIDLRDAQGPLEFGTKWENHTKTGDWSCSWVMTSDGVKTIKVVIRIHELQDGESLFFLDSQETRTEVIETARKYNVYYFPNEANLTLKYHRDDSSNEHFGFVAQASAFTVADPSCMYYGGNASNFTIVLGTGRTARDSFYVLSAPKYYSSGSSNFVNITHPYANNMKCKWEIMVEPGHELHVMMRFAELELCCDSLTVASASSDSSTTELGILGTWNHVFTKDTISPVSVTFTTDGNVQSYGFALKLVAVRCACNKYIPRLTRKHHSFDILFNDADNSYMRTRKGLSYCNNMNCSYEFHAPNGYEFLVVGAVGYLRKIPEDFVFVFDNSSTRRLSLIGDILDQRRFRAHTSVRGKYAKLVFQSGFSPILSGNATWRAQIRAFRVEHDFTHLTEEEPTAYKLFNDIWKWTITAPNRIQLYLYGSHFGRRLSENMRIYDGEESDSELSGEEWPIESMGGKMTIVRTRPNQRTDSPILFVKDSRQKGLCEQSLIHDVSDFSVSSGHSPCAVTIFAMNQYKNTLGIKSYIFLEAVSSIVDNNGFLEESNDTRVIAGTFANATVDKQTLLTLSEEAEPFEFRQRVITVLLPANTTFSSYAGKRDFSVLGNKRTVNLGSKGHISSAEYWQPNYRDDQRSRYKVNTTETTAITLNIFVDLHSNSRLYIESDCRNYSQEFVGTHFVHANVSFNCTGFSVDYTPSADGEKGFFVRYAFEDLRHSTTAADGQTTTAKYSKLPSRKKRRKKKSSATTAAAHLGLLGISLTVCLARHLFVYSVAYLGMLTGEMVSIDW